MEMTRKERIDRGLKVRTEGIYAISSFRRSPTWWDRASS